MKLVAFCGLKRSGKTTAARYLADKFDYEIESFAGPLKEAAKLIFCLTDSQVYGNKKEVLDPRWETTPRDLLQRIGTEVGREFDKNIWVKNMMFRVKGKSAVVIDDCRFPNEAEVIKSLGGYIIGIKRPGLEVDNHPSELEMVEHWDSMVDITVHNDADMAAFIGKIQYILDELGN